MEGGTEEGGSWGTDEGGCCRGVMVSGSTSDVMGAAKEDRRMRSAGCMRPIAVWGLMM